MNPEEALIRRAYAAFQADADAAPPMSLRSGDAVDRYDRPIPYDPKADAPTDAYLEQYAWGVHHLDPASWRHYLPRLIEYALLHKEDGPLIIDSTLHSLRPPDREPPRFAVLTEEQEAVIVAFLDVLAFDEHPLWQEDAMRVLEEYWIPDALYRKRR